MGALHLKFAVRIRNCPTGRCPARRRYVEEFTWYCAIARARVHSHDGHQRHGLPNALPEPFRHLQARRGTGRDNRLATQRGLDLQATGNHWVAKGYDVYRPELEEGRLGALHALRLPQMSNMRILIGTEGPGRWVAKNNVQHPDEFL